MRVRYIYHATYVCTYVCMCVNLYRKVEMHEEEETVLQIINTKKNVGVYIYNVDVSTRTSDDMRLNLPCIRIICNYVETRLQ